MKRTEITAQLVMTIDRLLANGVDHATIATRLGITEYVVAVIANDWLGRGRRPRIDKPCHRKPHPQQGVDVATVRGIQRMLDVGWLNYSGIAREAGVTRRLVEEIAVGKRPQVTTKRPFIFKDLGERFLAKSIRCLTCGASISIVPCRTCRALRLQTDRRQRFFSSDSRNFLIDYENHGNQSDSVQRGSSEDPRWQSFAVSP